VTGINKEGAEILSGATSPLGQFNGFNSSKKAKP
jgi:hypothetical protein